MNMYKSGELESVMKSFEKSLKAAPIYVGAAIVRAEKEDVEVDGVIQRRYRRNTYYENGNINAMFLMFFNGYAAGKSAEKFGEFQ